MLLTLGVGVSPDSTHEPFVCCQYTSDEDYTIFAFLHRSGEC